MPRYVAFLRGVSPMNAKMAELKDCFEKAGYTDVKTVLSSGNVVFSAPSASEAALAHEIEAAMTKHMGRTFRTIVRPVVRLRRMIKADPYASLQIPPKAKRVVTFLGAQYKARLGLPIETDGVQILAVTGLEVFTAYVPNPRGPIFMSLIEKIFGTELTTRTWDTVKKCAKTCERGRVINPV